MAVQGVLAREYFPAVGARIPVQQVRFGDMPPNALLIHRQTTVYPLTIEPGFVVAEDPVSFSQVRGERFSRDEHTTNIIENHPAALIVLFIRGETGIVHQILLVLVVEIMIVSIRGIEYLCFHRATPGSRGRRVWLAREVAPAS